METNKDCPADIVRNIGVISVSKSGWTMELNLISWNGKKPKYDIRSWSPDRKIFGKGITLYFNDLLTLADLISEEALTQGKEENE